MLNKNDLLNNLAAENVMNEVHSIIVEEMVLDPMAMLRRLYGITIEHANGFFTDDGQKYIYQIVGLTADRNRRDVATAAVDLLGLGGEAWNNAIKACETIAKRRLTTSLVGYGFKAPEGERTAATEPVQPEMPSVNHAPAAIIENEQDRVKALNESRERLADLSQKATAALESLPPAKVAELAQTLLPTVPAVSEATLAKMHSDAQKLDKPASDPTAAPKEKPAPPAVVGDIFDAVAPDTQAQFHPAPVEQPAPIQTSQIPELAQNSATPWKVDPTVADEPAPVKDIEVSPVVSDKPNTIQFKEFTMRCTKLCRDVLQKVNKEAASQLLPYLRKVFGVANLQDATIMQWETVLGRLEGAATPKDAFEIIKSGK